MWRVFLEAVGVESLLNVVSFWVYDMLAWILWGVCRLLQSDVATSSVYNYLTDFGLAELYSLDQPQCGVKVVGGASLNMEYIYC